MTTTTTNLWTVTETRKRLAEAAEAARHFSKMGLAANYRVELGLRRLPVAYTTRPSGSEVWATEKAGDDLVDYISPRQLKAADRDSEHYAQVFTPGAVVHLYFTSPGPWGELVDVITVWLGYGDHGPEVVGFEADRQLDEAAQAEELAAVPAGDFLARCGACGVLYFEGDCGCEGCTHTLDDLAGYRLVKTIEAGELLDEPVVVARFEGAGSYADALETRTQLERRQGVFYAIDRRYVCGCWSNVRSNLKASIGSR